MTTARRALAVLGMSVALVLTGSIPASALFADAVSAAATVSTATVAPATDLVVSARCVTTTTTQRTTTHASGRITTTTTTTTEPSDRNVEGTTTTTTSGPGRSQETTTTVTEDTELHATLSWTGSSTTRGLTGYEVRAHLADGTVYRAGRTDSSTTSLSDTADADVVDRQVQLSVRTLTGYGWTADSARTAPLSC